MFIGSAERMFAKPECISPEMERQWARTARSAGSNPASGKTSLRKEAMANVSHTVTSSCTRRGTRKEGDSSSSSALASGSSVGTRSSSKERPAILHSNQPRMDQEGNSCWDG